MMHLHQQLIASVTLCLLLCSSTAAGWSLSWSRSSTTEKQHQPKGQHGQITSLPGYAGDLPSKHYSGYISVGSRQLFYYAVESERTPAEDPIVLWLNGGPGCSSFDGWVYEQGPFKLSFSRDSNNVTLRDNPFRWNKVANMIFLDSPSPVGLSYSTHHADYNTNDTATATDSHAFLRAFFKRYPQWKHNDFFIAGESYAGIYVPMLAREVVKGNRRGVKPHINIQGYLVGNGCTDQAFDGNAQVPFAVGKSLISTSLYRHTQAACGGSYWDVKEGSSEADIWLNDPEVREAIHAAPQDVTGPWRLCSDRIFYTANGGSMLPVHNFLVREAGLRALIYSGDHDLCVPHTGSAAWTAAMHRSGSQECGQESDEDDSTLDRCDGVMSPWQAWYTSEVPKQVAGYVVDYDSGLSYATVKGAGHMVPETNPHEALDMFARFISGQPLAGSSSRSSRRQDSAVEAAGIATA